MTTTRDERVVFGTVQTDLVPSPMEYAVLLPPGYVSEDADADEAGGWTPPYPLLLILHGGRGSREVSLTWYREIIEDMWATGELSPIVVAMPSVTHNLGYLDWKTGGEKWETFLVGPFLEHLRATFYVQKQRDGLMVMGTSMGGNGSQRLAFRNPEVFGAVAGLEGAGPPVFEASEIEPMHQYHKDDAKQALAFGDPLDEEHWRANHPASIVAENAQRIIDSGLTIYIECGDEDMVNLHHGTEFLHRVLWDHGIRHEYRIVRGANHVGRSLAERRRYALKFFERYLHPEGDDPAVERSWAARAETYRTRVGRDGSSRGDWPYPLDGRPTRRPAPALPRGR